MTWALKNKPMNGKRVIGEAEIRSQASYAYDHSYAGFGCNSPAIEPFCDPSCSLRQRIGEMKAASGVFNS